MLQFAIDRFDLDTTTVHGGCSKPPPLKKHIASRLLVNLYKHKKEVYEIADTNALHIGQTNLLNCPNQNRSN